MTVVVTVRVLSLISMGHFCVSQTGQRTLERILRKREWLGNGMSDAVDNDQRADDLLQTSPWSS